MISQNVVALMLSSRPNTEDQVDVWFKTAWSEHLLGVDGVEWESKHLLAGTAGASVAPRYLVLYGLAPARSQQAAAAIGAAVHAGDVLHPEIDPALTTLGRYDLKAYNQVMDPDPIGRPGDV